MSRMVRFVLFASLIVGSILARPAWAENEGQADLDRAIELKLSAEKASDLSEVIKLCDSAITKGLDKENTAFAKKLEASALLQRATLLAGAIFRQTPVDSQWPKFRKLALDDLEKANKLVPDQPDVLLLIARLNVLPDGDTKRAAEALDQVLALPIADPGDRVKALALRAGVEKDDTKRLALLDEAVRLAPKDADSIRARGFVYADLKQPDKALADLDKAIELEPDNASSHQARALLLAQLKRYDEALVSLDKAQQIQPDSVSPLTLRAQVHAQQKNLEAALHDLNQALSRQPDNVAVLLLRASLYVEMDKPDAALADVDQALKLKPDYDRARRLRAVLLAKAGKLDQVITELEALAAKSPKDLQLQAQLAMFYTVQKNSQKAAERYTAILAEKPDDVEALSGRANALLGLGKHAEAIADYNKALKLDPEDSNMLNNLAWVLATSPDDKLRDGKRAIGLATKACDLTEYKAAHILSTLAAGYAETGDFDSAVKWSKKAVELGKEDAEPEVQESLVKELQSYEAKKPWRERLQEGSEAKPK
jgi:tetratricopeptide (TPR) repeat protein